MKNKCPKCGHEYDTNPAAALGAKGGAAGGGTALRAKLNAKAGKARWAGMTKAERSAERKRRAAKRKNRRPL